jgi:hypothetical protein
MKRVIRHTNMASKKPKSPAPPEFAEPEALAEGFRRLQQRIPGFATLSPEEEQKMARAEPLDPKFVENGLRVAAVAPDITHKVGRSALQLASEAHRIRRWDVVLRELEALMKGIAGANLKRQHQLDEAVLQIFTILSIKLYGPDGPEYAYLQPYYDKMKLAHATQPGKPRPVRKKAKS